MNWQTSNVDNQPRNAVNEGTGGHEDVDQRNLSSPVTSSAAVSSTKQFQDLIPVEQRSEHNIQLLNATGICSDTSSIQNIFLSRLFCVLTLHLLGKHQHEYFQCPRKCDVVTDDFTHTKKPTKKNVSAAVMHQHDMFMEIFCYTFFESVLQCFTCTHASTASLTQ